VKWWTAGRDLGPFKFSTFLMLRYDYNVVNIVIGNPGLSDHKCLANN
jgi:hypothetical protein